MTMFLVAFSCQKPKNYQPRNRIALFIILSNKMLWAASTCIPYVIFVSCQILLKKGKIYFIKANMTSVVRNLISVGLCFPLLHVQGLQRMLCLRQYSGRISFVPAPGFEAYGEPTRYDGKFTSTKSSINPGQEQHVKAEQYSYQGPDVDLTNLEWRTINGPFISVWLHNVPWGGEGTMAAPDAKVCLYCACHVMHNVIACFPSCFPPLALFLMS